MHKKKKLIAAYVDIHLLNMSLRQKKVGKTYWFQHFYYLKNEIWENLKVRVGKNSLDYLTMSLGLYHK